MKGTCVNSILTVSDRWRVALRVAAVGILGLGLISHYSAWAQDTSPTLEIVHFSNGDTVRAGTQVQLVMVLKGGTLEGASISLPDVPTKIQVSPHTIVATFEVPDSPGSTLLLGAKVTLSDGTPLVEVIGVTIVD